MTVMSGRAQMLTDGLEDGTIRRVGQSNSPLWKMSPRLNVRLKSQSLIHTRQQKKQSFTIVLIQSGSVAEDEPGTEDDPRLILNSSDLIEATCKGGTFDIAFTLENPVLDGVVSADTESSWIETDISLPDEIIVKVHENASDTDRESEVVVTYDYDAGNKGDSFVVRIKQMGTYLDAFDIEAPEAEITASSARIVASCNDPAIYWTSQIMTQDEFDMYVGDKANMEQYFMDLLESTANYYGYSSVVELLPDFLYPGDYVDDYTYSGLYSETKYLTYAVGMDLEANFTTDFYWGPEFTTLEMQVIDLTFEIVATPSTTEVSLDIYPSDKAAYYFATVIDDWWSYGYTDEDIMNDICSQYSSLLPSYAQTGDVTGHVVGGMNPGMDYYAIAFGVDVNALTFNSALTVEPFSTLEGEETDAYAEVHCTNYWSIADLEAYNPEYGGLLSDPAKPNIAAVDHTYNETATSAVFVMWVGDVSDFDYDELYSVTMSHGEIVYKGDPAPLYYVAFDGSYSTLCTIGRDAAGNFGDMHISVVQFTEEGKSTDFALFDEYYTVVMNSASMNSFKTRSNIENEQADDSCRRLAPCPSLRSGVL